MPIHKLKTNEYPDIIIMLNDECGIEKIYSTKVPQVKIAFVDKDGKVEIRTQDEAFVNLNKVSNYGK